MMRHPDFFVRRVPITDENGFFLELYKECEHATGGVYMPRLVTPCYGSREALVYFEQNLSYLLVSFLLDGEYLILDADAEDIETVMSIDEINLVNADKQITINGTTYCVVGGCYTHDVEDNERSYTFEIETIQGE